MGKYFNIFCPVYGVLGPETILDTVSVPPVMILVHYILDETPKSDLFKGPRCYLISKRLAEALEAAKLSGFQLAECIVRADPQKVNLGRKIEVGHYACLKISGRQPIDDFGLDRFSRIVVSEAALAVLRQFNLEECQIIDSNEAPTPEERMEKNFADEKARLGRL